MTFQVEIDEIDRDMVEIGILRSLFEMILEIGLANRVDLQLVPKQVLIVSVNIKSMRPLSFALASNMHFIVVGSRPLRAEKRAA